MISSDIWSRSSRCLGTLVMLLLAVACTQQREMAEELVATRQGTEVQIDFSVPRFGKSRVENTPTLKSVEGGDFENEATVKKIYLFYASSAAPEATLSKVVLDYSSSPVISGLFSTRLDLAEGSYDFYAVANPTASLEEALRTVTTRQALSDMKVTISESELRAPFIMYGEAKSVTISATERVAMRLQRLVSQIEVVMKDKRFTIASAQLYNGAKSCYLSPHRDPVTGKSLTPAVAGERYKETKGSLSNDSRVAHLFTLEYFSYDRTGDSGDTDPASDQSIYLIVRLLRDGRDWGFFRIDPADYRGEQLIYRNGLYQVYVKEVRGDGYYEIEEAKANKATNLVLEYAQDADGFISKYGVDYRYVKSDGQYYLAMEDRDLQLVKAGRTDLFRLETNVPEDKPEIQVSVDYTDPAKEDPLYENWLTVEVNKDETSGRPNGLIITRTALPDYRNMEGIGERSPVRKAIIRVIVVGHPNLYTEIPVTQLPDDGYFDNLDADPSLHVSNGAQREVFYSTIATTFPDTYWYINKIYDSKGVDLLNPDLPEQDKWIHVTLDTNPVEMHESYGPIYMGPSSLTIVADALPEGSFYREGYIELKLWPFYRDFPSRSVTIRVVSGLGLDYRITYPDSEPKKRFMERTTRVIESSLYQTENQTYSINVSSTMKWEVKASHDWITITQPTFDKGSYNSTFTITLPPNDQGEVIGGLHPAREGYVDIIGDQFFKRIMVYQGGYVRIGEEIWMDRNLKVSRFVGGSQDRKRYVIKTDGDDNELPPRDLLYACAVPIAQPGDEPVIYAYGRFFNDSPSDWGGSTTVPTSTYGGDKGTYFSQPVNPAPIDSYNTWYYFSGRHVPEANDGYFSWGMYGTFPAQTSNQRRMYNAWNRSYKTGVATNVMQLPTSKGVDNDPCPEGWRVPSYAELFRLNRYLTQARIYANGTEDYLPAEGLEDAAKNGMINNGVFFYNDDKVSCWFPFAGFRAMSTDEAFSIVSEGVKTAFWANFSSDGMNAFRATLEYQNAFIEYWNGNFSNPVRCIQDNTIE